jgi:glycine betaine/proline transport system substrate-binding protein
MKEVAPVGPVIDRPGRAVFRRARVALVAAVALALAGCGGATVGGSGGGGSGGSGGSCGTVNLAVNPWVGYEADAAVYSYVAKTKLNCNVVQKDLKEQVAWQGFGTGEVDLILENWGHPELVQQYITDQKTAVDLGLNGNKGIIGWYVPPWLAQAHPDITDWQNLNKYADQFRTSESGDKGQLLDGDPSYVTNDNALVTNLKLNFKVVQSGSEPALIQSFRTAEQQKKFFLAYFWQPQWIFDEIKLARVNLPPFKEGCATEGPTVACDYPPYNLNKIASTKFANSGSPAIELAKKFNWTNNDQNTVARYIALDKMSPEAAAKKWVDANQDKVKAWLPAGVS